MKIMPVDLCVEIQSSTRYLSALRGMTAALVKKIPTPFKSQEMRIRCELALTEAVNNSIFHAHRSDESKWISVRWKITLEGLTMTVEDSGKGFSFKKADLPNDLINHGRGLYIIRSMMDSVKVRSVNGRQRLSMTCRLGHKREG